MALGTVLIVDDEDLVLRFVSGVLKTAGYEVLSTRSGEEALKVCANYSGRLDLLIADIRMPRMNGRVLAHRLSEVRPGLPALFMSGFPGELLDAQDYFETGAGFLMKPFSAQELLARVRFFMATESCHSWLGLAQGRISPQAKSP